MSEFWEATVRMQQLRVQAKLSGLKLPEPYSNNLSERTEIEVLYDAMTIRLCSKNSHDMPFQQAGNASSLPRCSSSGTCWMESLQGNGLAETAAPHGHPVCPPDLTSLDFFF
jgi:hypothetical protein